MAKQRITPREDDYSRWYTDVIQHAELADYSPVRGCMVIRPYGYAIWEGIKDELDQMIKDTGHQNAYFPMFIPQSFMTKEAEHVEGFAPECAVVTHGGGKELEEPLFIRPTSETIIYHMYAKWVQSWRDLPILINQWANVCRWELRTRMFLRTCEFLWQEGHTAHATRAEAEEEARKMLGVYRTLARDVMAMPVITGKKSEAEKFAGALHTYTIEAMMQDLKALQAGTSHNLGQNFAMAFDLKFQDQEGEISYAWNTSWGVSTRLVGALIMSHSDDKGLVLPPRLAPIQIVIVPIWRSSSDEVAIREACAQLKTRLTEALEAARKEGRLTAVPRRINVEVDDRNHLKPGPKFYEWERKGVPLRIELGPRDLKKDQLVYVRRDTGEKSFVPQDEFVAQAADLLQQMQQDLYDQSEARLEENTRAVTNYDEFKQLIEEGGFARVRWCDDPELEQQIKNETMATVRCFPFEPQLDGGPCFYSGRETATEAIFAKAY